MGKGEGDIAAVLTALGSRRDDLRVAQELIEVLPIPLFFKSRDGRYLGVNRAWEDFFAVSRADIIGGSVRDLYPDAPKVAERHAAKNRLHCIETWSIDDPAIREFLATSRRETFVPGKSGMIRRVLATGQSVWIDDVSEKSDFQRGPLATAAGLRGAFALPVLMGERVLGAIEFFSRDARHPDKWLLQGTVAIGSQIGPPMARRAPQGGAPAPPHELEGEVRELAR